MDLNSWFHWLFSSPGYFLLALVGVLVLIGLIAGLIDTRKLDDAHNSPPDVGESESGLPWWTRDELHYREWNEHQVLEQHRTAGRHSPVDW